MLRCLRCGRTYQNTFRLKCDCGGILDVVLYFERPFEKLLNRKFPDVRRYLNFLPVNRDFLPSLTLPVTPVIEREFGNVRALFKLEYLMPSGSFKDRGTYVTIAKLKEEGIKEVSLDSSGNAAISLALFGKSENIKVHVFIPKHTSEGKKRLLRLLKAEIHEVEGSRMEVHEKAREFGKAAYVSHWFNPYFIEGTKIITYETFEQGKVDCALVPTGSGTLFLGVYKGFKELLKFGLIERFPKLIAVQARGFESLCERGREESKLAEGIAIPDPPRKGQMIKVLRETRGFCISVGDDEIKRALEELVSMGFIVEPTSATVYAAFRRLLESGKLEGRVLLPLTGSGLKAF